MTRPPRDPLLAPKAFYFLYYAAFACVVPFLTLYYQELELTGRQIGWLAGLVPLTMLVAAPLWGGLGDATGRHKSLLVLALAGSFAAVLALTLSTGFAQLAATAFFYALFLSPIMPLVDNSVMQMLGARRHRYGRQRFWGAVGYGLAALAAGGLAQWLGLRWGFYISLALTVAAAAVAIRLPAASTGLKTRFRKGLQQLLVNWQWLLFLGAILTGGMGLSVILNFLFLHMNELGADPTMMGLAIALATLSEMPVLFFADRFLGRLKPQGLLIFALGILALRIAAYSFVGVAWLVLPLQLLHGLTFGLLWVAGVTYTAELAPEGMGATAQGLFAGVMSGLGAAAGAVLGGFLYDSVGLVAMFRWVGAIVLIGAVLLTAGDASRRPKPRAG